jgi:hypothetical protein
VAERDLQGALQLRRGSVPWWRQEPAGEGPLYLCAHGAGAPAASAFMVAVAGGLVARGIGVVRFDFPYMAGAGRHGPPDAAPILLDACRAVYALARGWDRERAIVVGGKSMGGRMWSMLLAADSDLDAAGAVYLGYPLHPPGRPEKLRREHLAAVRPPQLFVSGSRDTLARLDLLRAAVEALPRSTLHVVDGGDHSLAVRKRTGVQGSEEWLDVTAQFVHACAAATRRG